MPNSPVSTLMAHAWKLLRVEGGGTDLEAMQEDFMLTLFSQANTEYLRAHRRGGGSEPLAMLRDGGVDLVADTAIDDADGISASDTSVTVDAHSFPDASGAAVIWDDGMPDVFTYAAKTATAFTGVSGLAFAHEDGDVVQALRKLPSNFRRFRPADGYGDGVRVNGLGYRFMEGPPAPGFFTLHDDGTDKYLWLPRGLTGSAAFLYEKASATLDSADDTVDVPPEDEFFLVWRAVDLALFAKEEGELRAQARIEWRKALKESLNGKNVGRHVRVRLPGRGHDPERYALTHQQS